MLKLLLTLLLVGSLGVPSVADKLYDDLLAYHAGRVNPAHRHETEEQRQERIRWIADAIPKACAEFPFDVKLGWTLEQCVALTSTAAKWESGLIVEVHAGTRKGPSGELCLLQLHRLIAAVPDARYKVTQEERLATVGLGKEATYRCALAGVKTIAWHIHRCRLRADDLLSPSILFEQYHRPTTYCKPDFGAMSSRRALSYRALLAKIK